jgi:hypothetical protein
MHCVAHCLRSHCFTTACRSTMFACALSAERDASWQALVHLESLLVEQQHGCGASSLRDCDGDCGQCWLVLEAWFDELRSSMSTTMSNGTVMQWFDVQLLFDHQVPSVNQSVAVAHRRGVSTVQRIHTTTGKVVTSLHRTTNNLNNNNNNLNRAIALRFRTSYGGCSKLVLLAIRPSPSAACATCFACDMPLEAHDGMHSDWALLQCVQAVRSRQSAWHLIQHVIWRCEMQQSTDVPSADRSSIERGACF